MQSVDGDRFLKSSTGPPMRSLRCECIAQPEEIPRLAWWAGGRGQGAGVREKGSGDEGTRGRGDRGEGAR